VASVWKRVKKRWRRAYLVALSKSLLPTCACISVTVSLNCFIKACPFNASTEYECVAAGIIMNATTVISLPDSFNLPFKPYVSSELVIKYAP
jgi:hypothetical protein